MTYTPPRLVDAGVEHEGDWWIITVPELDLSARARRLRDVHTTTIATVASALHVDETDVALDAQRCDLLHPTLQGRRAAQLEETPADPAVLIRLSIRLPGDVDAKWTEARSIVLRADALRRDAVRELVDGAKLTHAEAAVLLDISRQRVTQLVSERPHE